MHHPNLSHQRLRRFLGLMAGGALLWLPLAASAEPSSSHDAHPAVQHTAMSHQTPGWAEKLKGQTILEDTMAGRPEPAANIEISINQWLDFYPGYMYVLTENLEKAREEEAKNKAAREKEGYDPGAVSNGLQNQWIQPLVIRANQGDCVKFTLQNKLEG